MKLRSFFVSGLLALSLPMSTFARPVAGVEVPPPLPAGTVTETHWGTAVPDPWRQLENVKDPQVQQWLRGQADATTAIMKRIPGRAAVLQRMQEIESSAAGLVSRVVRSSNGRLFFLRRNPGDDQFKLVWRDGPGGEDRVIVDPQALSKASASTLAILDYQPSPDGSKLAYALQSGGGEIGSLHVVDVASGKALVEPIDRIRFASASWLQDGSGLFFARLREGYEKADTAKRFEDRTSHFLSLSGKDAGKNIALVSASRNPEMALPAYASPYLFQLAGSQQVAALIYFGVERNTRLYLAPLKDVVQGRARWQQVYDTPDEISDLAQVGDQLYLRSAKGAPRYRILRMSLADAHISKASVAVDQGAGVIVNLSGARDALYYTQRDGVNTVLQRLSAKGGATESVSLPVQGSTEIAFSDSGQDGALLTLAGWTRAPKTWAVGTDGKTTRLALAQDGAFDSIDSIEAREVLVPSHDGVRVPLSIIAKKGLKLDGSNPTIVYGYGAYGITEDPGLNPRLLAYLERGGVFAIAHVRGGGVYGNAWHDGGKKATKPNTWKDGIAAAEWLIANGYTSRAKVGVYGGSAGGIFVGRAITERPELFAAAVPTVGSMDTLRSEFSANGPANIPEFGTVKKEDEFRALLAMSSYHQIKDGQRYPAVLLSHGVNDIRVDVWQSAKFASRMAAATAKNDAAKPVLMRLEYEGGHGSGSTRAQAQERSADIYSFFLWQFGVAEFQPLAP